MQVLTNFNHETTTVICYQMTGWATNVCIELNISELHPSELHWYINPFNDTLCAAYVKLYRFELGRKMTTKMNLGSLF
jgi:hypothetical protein